MKCEHIRKLLTSYLLNDLASATNEEIQSHIRKCTGCRAAAQEIEPTLDLLRDALAAPSPVQAPKHLSPSRRAHILAALCTPAQRPERQDWWIYTHHKALAAAAALMVVCGGFAVLLQDLFRMGGVGEPIPRALRDEYLPHPPTGEPPVAAAEEPPTETAEETVTENRQCVFEPEPGRAPLPGSGVTLSDADRNSLKAIRARAVEKLYLGDLKPGESADPVQLAEAHYRAGNYDDAWDLYSQNVGKVHQRYKELDPNFTTWLIDKNTSAGHFDTAESLARSVIQWMDTTPDALPKEARLKTMLSYANIAKSKPEYPRAKAIYGQIAAAQEFDGMRAQSEAQLKMADIELETGQPDEAIARLEKLLKKHDPYIQTEANVELAKVYYQCHDYAAAREALAKAFAYSPNHPEGRILDGKTQLAMRRIEDATCIDKIGIRAEQEKIVPGKPLRITVEDPTLNVVGRTTKIDVRAWTDSGDEETFAVRPFTDSRTRFAGEISTKLAPIKKGDGTLQVLGQDQVHYDFSPAFKKENRITDTVSSTLTTASDAKLYASSGRITTTEEVEKRAVEDAIEARLSSGKPAGAAAGKAPALDKWAVDAWVQPESKETGARTGGQQSPAGEQQRWGYGNGPITKKVPDDPQIAALRNELRYADGDGLSDDTEHKPVIEDQTDGRGPAEPIYGLYASRAPGSRGRACGALGASPAGTVGKLPATKTYGRAPLPWPGGRATEPTKTTGPVTFGGENHIPPELRSADAGNRIESVNAVGFNKMSVGGEVTCGEEDPAAGDSDEDGWKHIGGVPSTAPIVDRFWSAGTRMKTGNGDKNGTATLEFGAGANADYAEAAGRDRGGFGYKAKPSEKDAGKKPSLGNIPVIGRLFRREALKGRSQKLAPVATQPMPEATPPATAEAIHGEDGESLKAGDRVAIPSIKDYDLSLTTEAGTRVAVAVDKLQSTPEKANAAVLPFAERQQAEKLRADVSGWLDGNVNGVAVDAKFAEAPPKEVAAAGLAETDSRSRFLGGHAALVQQRETKPAAKPGRPVYYRYLPRFEQVEKKEISVEESRDEVPIGIDDSRVLKEVEEETRDRYAASAGAEFRPPSHGPAGSPAEDAKIIAREEEQPSADSLLLRSAEAAYRKGEIGAARKLYEQVMAEYPASTVAAKAHARLERIDGTLGKNKMSDVRRTWNTRTHDAAQKAEGDGAQVLQRLKKVKLPEVDFRQANINDVVAFLNEATAEHDEEKNDRADIVLQLGPQQTTVAPPADEFGSEPPVGTAGAGTPLITFNGRHISADEVLKIVTQVANLKYRIDGDKIVVEPRNAPDSDIVVRMYDVAPAARAELASLSAASTSDSVVDNTGLSDFFVSAGVPVPSGASFKYDPASGKLIAANTPSNLVTFERILTSLQEAADRKAKEKAESEVKAAADAKEKARFKAFGVNPFYSTAERAFSTFAIDVDTAAYTLARNYMQRGFLPPAESVRTEEFVNFFDYGYAPPKHGTFAIYADCAPSKFGRGLQMLKIGVKGRRLGREEERPAVLTFLIDTSGSMNQPDRLELVKTSLRMLVNKLGAKDMVAIVQYDADARLVVEHTPAADKKKLLDAIDSMQCGGATNLEKGMNTAYRIAADVFAPGAENRVLLLSDGVANLGADAARDILQSVESYRKQGIFCSVFGFGIGTYDDEMLESLANKGNGAYVFIDSEAEAQRVFVDDLAATLNTIASDVKIQVQFNSKYVKRYRQLGYENRQLKKKDFRNDAVDAGEVGSGQSVTALYELDVSGANVEALRGSSEWIAMVRVRYRRTDTGDVEEIERPVGRPDICSSFDNTDVHFKLASCAAEFAEILRGSPFTEGSSFEDIARVLRPVTLDLSLDDRVQELARMVQGAGSMSRGE